VKKLKHYPDKILGCSYQGLFILKKENNKWLFSHFIRGGFNVVSSMFEENDKGEIWFSLWQKGIFKLKLNSQADSIVNIELYDKNKGFPTNRNNTFYKVAGDLIFSSEGGFLRYNEQTDRMEIDHKWNNLFVTPPTSIRLWEGNTGDVWCISGTFFGVAKLQQDGAYVMDSLTYGILRSRIIAGFENLNFLKNKSIIVSTGNNFSWIDLQKTVKPNGNFRVFLRNVSVTSKRNPVAVLPPRLQENENDVFEKSQNSIRFEFAAPFFQGKNLVQYSYQLKDYDKEWSDWSHVNTKEYTSLPRGNYVFRIKAKETLKGQISEYTYHFTILPAWYETIFAHIIYFLLLVGLLIMLFLFIKKRSEKGAVEMEKKKELELQEKEKIYEQESFEKQKEIIKLKNQKLNYELRHKSQELANSAMNLIRKNEMLIHITEGLSRLNNSIQENSEKKSILQNIAKIELEIKQNISNDDTWKRFEENFDIVYEDFLKKLGKTFPELNINDKKLCAYLKMGLSSKDIASILGVSVSVRSVETNRYRLRKKLNLDQGTNLTDFLQRFE
ncbi:MAG: hypothetical protein LBR55_00070, partial [Bacteroidales bacterium]|nr:hypothetical protein [Bacteroidales bacterium]